MTDLLAGATQPQPGNDLSQGYIRKALSAQIGEAIDDYCAVTYDDGHRTHLGASLIGHPCSRNLWYVFRWVKHVKHSGRMQRLFNRGKREEDRFVEWLRGIGCQVWEKDEHGNQFRVSGVMGHFGGSLDGVITLPAQFKVTEPLLCEFKTNGTGSGFTKLQEKGVQFAKDKHFAQMSIYGAHYKFRYALYLNINKNDDSIHPEIVALDWNFATQLQRKAEVIIMSQTPPPKFASSPAVFECKMCDFKDICHNNAPVEKNCRSCHFAAPIDDAQWHCTKWNNTIPKDFITTGCDQWQSINV